MPTRAFTVALPLLLLALTGAAKAHAAVAEASNAPGKTVKATALPIEIPAAEGNQPLQNPAPAAADAPRDSSQITPPTVLSRPVVLPAVAPGIAPMVLSPTRVQTGCSLRDYGAPVARGQLAAAVFNTCSGFSLHKPTFLTLSYSPRFPGAESEVVFQFSGKAQLWNFGPGSLYFAYTQKSFFQVFNEKRSKAFRESNYNPELFIRLPRPLSALPNWSIEGGLEHESNGADLPSSRSYNRLYLAPYWTRGQQAVQLKAWYRLPEDRGRAATDPKRDDNPDLASYYGYTELRYRRDFPQHNGVIDVLLRGNTATGRGAVQVDYSAELGRTGAIFVRVFNGYGDSLVDYNRSVTRVNLGLALQR